MPVIRLTEAQRKNLIEFLNRVEYKGINEAIALTSIIGALNDDIELKEGGNDSANSKIS